MKEGPPTPLAAGEGRPRPCQQPAARGRPWPVLEGPDQP